MIKERKEERKVENEREKKREGERRESGVAMTYKKRYTVSICNGKKTPQIMTNIPRNMDP